MAEHTEITAGEIHSPFQWVVANATARNAITAEGAHDLHKLCLQLDTLQVYRMSVTSPVTWSQVGMVNPMTTAEDLIVGGTSGSPARLAVGANGHVLTVVSGSIAWAAATGGFTNPMTTQGDIITGGASGAPQRLAKGTSGHFLKAGATDPAYAAIVANDVSDATTPGKALLTAADVAAQRQALLIPTGPLSGFRNAIINGNFGINQRAVSGTVTLAAGAYGHDRWKAGASGCTYTFATSANVTTLTITAGTLLQVIEGANLQSGAYVLSWSGTAQARIDAGSYGDTGITGTATGGTNQTIEFGTGTVSKVQYEPGSIASAFELRPISTELALCQRYYYRFIGGANAFVGLGFADNSTTAIALLNFPTQMRAAPTALEQSGTATHYGMRVPNTTTLTASAVPTHAASQAVLARFVLTVSSGLTAGWAVQISVADGGYLGWSAEL